MDKTRNNFGNQLLQFCKNNNLYICNGRLEKSELGAFTCVKGSVIDYLISNINGLIRINDFTVHDYVPTLSDVHSAISFMINIQLKKSKPNPIVYTYKKWDASKREDFVQNIDRNVVNENEIKRQLQCPSRTLNRDEIESAVNKIKHLFINTAKATFKKYTVISSKVKSSKPWFGLQCRKAQRKYYMAKRNNSVEKSEASRRKMMNACKKYKTTITKYHGIYIRNLQNKIRKMRTEKPKDYWRLIHSIDRNKDEMPISIDVLFNYFKTLNSNDIDVADEEIQNNENIFHDRNFIENANLHIPPSALNDHITENEIISSINLLKQNKSSGTDNIINEYIISTKHIMIQIYVKLFNDILETGNIPSDWVSGSIIPIYKNKGSKADPENYRPVTLLSCLGKLFTCILNNRLTKYMEDNNLLSEIQSGFRKDYATLDNIFSLYSLLEYHKSKKTKLYCCFIDFTKAFDNVWRIGLWQKLIKQGIQGKILNVIKNMYAKIKSCILLNGLSSDYFYCEKGVRQGENLSPLLFSLYLNDLETYLSNNGCDSLNIDINDDDVILYLKLFAILYADDTILMSDDVNKFQNLLNSFASYCKEWRLQINLNKTKVMIFGGNSRSNNLLFTIDGKRIEIVREFKYLGVLFTQNGRFVQNVKKISEIACKAMYLLRKRIVNLHLPVDCQLKLFDQTIVPILLYGSEVYGFENLCNIEKIHLDFLKSILKMKKSTPHIMVYGEFGRYPLEILVKVRMVKFWCKLVKGKYSKISNRLYKLLYYLHKNHIYFSKWTLNIESILQNVGLNFVWLNNIDTVDINWICREVRFRLECQFVQKWKSDVFDSSKCFNYRIFKTDFLFEKYITELPANSYIALAKFRTTNNRLPIEKGRWDNIDRNERYCNLCNTNLIGDEFHYIFECEFFNNVRKMYLPKYYLKHYNTFKFAQLMSNSSTKQLHRLSQFVTLILRMFK
ncbi:MAG: reverse transcriptase family protein [Candidatus Thiodiazotropha sp.]